MQQITKTIIIKTIIATIILKLNTLIIFFIKKITKMIYYLFKIKKYTYNLKIINNSYDDYY